MNKILSYTACFTAMLMIAMLISACEARPVHLDEPAEAAPPQDIMPEPRPRPTAVRDSQAPSHATMEYGRPYIIKDNNGPLFAFIRFPQAGNAADVYIFDWAHEIYLSAREALDALIEHDPYAVGEINVHFDSHLIDEKYAGVVMHGSFTHSHMDVPQEIVRTFNINASTGTLLDDASIISRDGHENVLEILHGRVLEKHPYVGETLADINERWLSHMVLGHDGITVMLDRYVHFSERLGTLSVTLPYNEIGPALLLSISLPEPEPVSLIDPTRPIVALTFDDGPSRYTWRLLDILEAHGARATFCVLGDLSHANREVLIRAVEMGNEVIGHSWDHSRMVGMPEEEVRRQILDTSRAIEEITGIRTNIFRPPYGTIDDELKRISGELGYAILYWSIDPEDWRYRDADHVYEAIMRYMRNGSIVLSHDLYRSTVDAMERLIPRLIAEGYQLVTVSELLIHAHGSIEPGVVYINGYPRNNDD